MKNDGGSAFPWYNGVEWCRGVYSGMTMRQAYKMAALSSGNWPHNGHDINAIADWAASIADSALAEDAEMEGK